MVADLCKRHDVICVSDEVYEVLIYSGSEHCRIGRGKRNISANLSLSGMIRVCGLYLYIEKFRVHAKTSFIREEL